MGGTLAGLGAWWHYPSALGLGASLVVLAAVATIGVCLPRPVQVERSITPLEVQRGQGCTATLRIRNGSRWRPLWAQGVERVDGSRVPIRAGRIARRGVGDLQYEIPTERRGILLVEPLELVRRDPAGLAASTQHVGTAAEVRVLPRIHPVANVPSGTLMGEMSVSDRISGGGTNLISLREYVPGDDLRWLHCATSARTGKLMVREDAEPTQTHMNVIVDDRAAAYGGSDSLDFEEAVDVAASLALAAVDQGHSVRVVTMSGAMDEEVCDPSTGPRRLIDALTPVHAVAESGTAALAYGIADVMVAVTGDRANGDGLLAMASASAVGIMLVVATQEEPSAVSMVDGVAVVRAGSAGELLRLFAATVTPGATR